MRKAIIIIILAVASLILGYGLYAFLRGEGSPVPNGGIVAVGTSTPSQGSSSVSTPQNIPTSDTITIGTPQGGVTINNPYKNAAYVTPDNRQYFILNTGQYGVYYYPFDSSFVIGIDAMPVLQVQQLAEQAFLQKLGISRTDACKLTVWVGVPVSVDANYAGRNLGLSFCPQGQ